MPYRAVTIVTMLALIAWTIGLPAWIHKAHADSLKTVSDTLSDSDIGVPSDHTIQFTTLTAIDADASYIEITFPTGWDLSSIDTLDIDIADDGADLTVGATCAATNFSRGVTGQVLTLTDCGGGQGSLIATSSVVTIEIGKNATSGGAGTNQIINPSSATSSVINIKTYQSGGTLQADTDTRVAIIDDVTVTASVDTVFTFSVNAVNAGTTVNDDVTVTSGTTTATSVPFGTLSPGTAKLLAQRLQVDTNAQNGFSVSVFADQTLSSGNGSTIDTFIDGAATASSTQWAGPTATLGSPNTYGHWGVTSDDDVVSSSTPNLWGTGEALYAGNFVNNPVEVFYNGAPVTAGSGTGVGSTDVAYKIEISALQEAAKDYTATLTYIATPVF